MEKISKHAKSSEQSQLLCDTLLASLPGELLPIRESSPNVCGVHIQERKSALYWLYHYKEHIRIYLYCEDTAEIRKEVQALLPASVRLQARPYPRKGVALRIPLYFEIHSADQARNLEPLLMRLCGNRRNPISRSRSLRVTPWAPYSESRDQESQSAVEGDRALVLVNKYERSQGNRVACIRAFGAVCSVCGFDFSITYGKIGEGYIHVHHLTKLAALKGKSQKVDPIKDLRPVCPNCHEMLHRNDPPYTIDQLKQIIANVAKDGAS